MGLQAQGWMSFILAGALLLPACSHVPAAQPQNTPEPKAAAGPAGGVKAPQWTELSITPASLILGPGAKQKLTISAVAKDGTRKDITTEQGIVFQSSLPETAGIASDGTLTVAAGARTGARLQVTVQYLGLTRVVPVTIKYALADTVTAGAGGTMLVTNPTDMAVVVNKSRALPADYTPAAADLVEPAVPFTFKEKSEKKLMRKEAARALEKLFEQAAKDRIKLAGVSAYRSYASQKAIYHNNVKTQGEKLASQYSAKPGQSEHQTGLAIDVSSPSAKYALEESFGATPEGKWLAATAPAYGFIIRYPKGKEAITGYNYEPWHIRYVGLEAAKEIAEKGITLEEYFQDALPVNKPSSAAVKP